MGKYEVVLFDLDNTLVNYSKAEQKSLASIVKVLNLPVTEKEFCWRYRLINSALWLQLERGAVDLETLKQPFRKWVGGINRHPKSIKMPYMSFSRTPQKKKKVAPKQCFRD